VGTSQINSLASSDFTEQHTPSSEPQWRTTFPAVFQAATPSADFNYSRPAIAINSRPVTSRAPPLALRNASYVFTEHVNKSAYHLQPSINCGYPRMYCCDCLLPWKFCLSGCCLNTDLRNRYLGSDLVTCGRFPWKAPKTPPESVTNRRIMCRICLVTLLPIRIFRKQYTNVIFKIIKGNVSRRVYRVRI
jgi:hypothetical protein